MNNIFFEKSTIATDEVGGLKGSIYGPPTLVRACSCHMWKKGGLGTHMIFYFLIPNSIPNNQRI